LEALYEHGMADTLNRTDAAIGSGVEGVDEQVATETGAVSKQTADTLMAGERIVEAIDVADRERALFRAYEDERTASLQPENIPLPARNPIMAALNLNPEEYVLRTLEKVRATELFDALLVLPFEKVVSLFTYLNEWALRVSQPRVP
jgi:U3 small nucleolar RNA-associated protein 12